MFTFHSLELADDSARLLFRKPRDGVVVAAFGAAMSYGDPARTRLFMTEKIFSDGLSNENMESVSIKPDSRRV